MYKIKLSPYHRIFYNKWKIAPNGSNYNIVFDQVISNDLNLSKLKDALKRFITDYLIINSHIVLVNEEPYWVQNEDINEIVHSNVIDNNEIYDYVSKPFNLEDEPLYRFATFKNTQNGYRLILVFHHILVDGSSFSYITSEISKYYNYPKYKAKFSIEEQVKLIGKANNKLLKSLKQDASQHKLFWKEKLSAVDPIDLRFIKNSASFNAQQTNTIQEVRFSFVNEIFIKLNTLKNLYGLTPYRYGQMIFSILLHHYTSQEKLPISYPIAVKEYHGLAYGVGVNTCICVYNVDKLTKISDLIIQSNAFVDEINKGLVPYAHYPINEAINGMNKGLLDVMFAQTNLKDFEFSFDNVATLKVNHEFNIDLPCQLLFEQEVSQQRHNYRVRYSTTVLDELTLVQFIKHYQKLFIEILDDLSCGISKKLVTAYNILFPNEYKQIVYDWNKTEKEYPQDKTIHQLFEEQVAKTPHNIAVMYEDVKLTYKELNERSNQLANYLRGIYKIQGDDLIALCLNRSEDTLIAILGVLKSGAAYVPIDSESPVERVNYILEDTQAKILVTDSTYYSSISDHSRKCMISPQDLLVIDNREFIRTLSKYQVYNLVPNITSKNLAYVIYTSGTTGKPKGVLIEHLQVTLFMQGFIDKLSKDRLQKKHTFNMLSTTNYVFDIFGLEYLLPLLNGSFISLVNMRDFINQSCNIEVTKYDYVQLTPSKIGLLLSQISPNTSSNLHKITLLIGGEALTASHIKLIHGYELKNSNVSFKIMNLYGPTESTIWSTMFLVNNTITIGRPLNNETVYVLDSSLKPLPIGAVGELYIGGGGVARGYLRQQKLTKERFIANPFQTEKEKQHSKNHRLYKTGDLVRYLPDSNLEYIGRNDFQVKIRGYRVELGEIELQLSEYSGIKQSVVIVFETPDKENDGNINKYLVAYYVSDTKLDEAEILSNLSCKLPNYMLPKILIHLDRLPLNISGKLDRKSLPKPVFDATTTYIAPSNELEAKVCAIFAKVLGLEKSSVGVDDDFFQLGGNSISAINLANKLNNFFYSAIKVIDIFNNKTSRNISVMVKESLGKFEYQEYLIGCLDIDNLYKSFDLSNVQQAYYFGRLGEFELGNISTHIYSELIFNELDTQKLEEALNRLIAYHVGLRTIFINGQQQYLENTPWYKIIFNDFSNEREFANNSDEIDTSKASNERKLLAVRDKLSHKIYNADQFPLFDFIVSKLNGYYILHISVDALLMDGNSYNTLFNQLRILYDNPQAQLPTLNVTYREYIIQLMQIRQSALYNTARSYWQNKLENYNFIMSLPLKCKVSQVGNPTFSRVSTIIDKATWQKIEDKAKINNISSTALILNLYGRVLSYWTNQNKLCINLTLFSRLPLHPQINEVIGDFTSLELFNYRQKDAKSSILSRLLETHKELWADIEHNLFDGIDFQRLIRKESKLPSNYIIAPVVLTSMLGSNTIFSEAKLISNSYQGVNYSITQTSQLWLDNKAYTTKDGFVAEWDYVEQLFERSMIENMHAHYCYLIKYLAYANWHNEFPNLRAPQEDIDLINKVNDVSQELSSETLFGFYENYVKQNKLLKNIAVIDNKNLRTPQEYSYANLLNESDLLAKYLCNIDIKDIKNFKASALIAILSEKGYNQVVTSAAIMKAGFGYLPLHVDWPIGRVEEILEQGEVATILISKQQANIIKVNERFAKKYKVFVIEDILVKIARDIKLQSRLDEVLLPHVNADDIAYVIFTSGSTGIPKGVTISHKGALNTNLAVNNRFKVTAADKVLALSELSFDLSVYDIFGLLAVGGTLVFPNQDSIKEPKHWIKLIHKYGITIWNTVPQLAGLLIDSVGKNRQKIESLRLFLMSGDLIPFNLPRSISQICSAAQVVSLGGATEGSIWSVWYEILNKMWTKIPYGTPMPNQNMYVLDNILEYSPIGVTGEIYIGGVGIALNYWRDNTATKECFILHPQLGRIYKTGDLGCWNKGGYIEFIGRIDNQVKISGYRVELEEIENKLVNYPNIKHAVVVLKDSLNNKFSEINYIVAYYVSPEKLDETLLRNYLEKCLPEYMIPHILIHLNKLPLTKNGKLDKNALPESNYTNISTYIVPRNLLEQQICAIYAKVLGIPINQIGVTDDFFRLGGNSILAIKLANKLSAELNTNIFVADLFKYKTIATVLKHLDTHAAKEIVITRVPLSKDSCYPLSFAEERLWFIEKYEDGSNAYNIPLIAEINPEIDLEILKQAISSVVARHEILHSLIRVNNFGESCQFIGDLSQKPLIFDEREVYTDSELHARINQSVNHIYHLTEEYPIRISLFNKTRRHYICIVVHHIAFDGWSIDIFLNEVREYYNYYNKLKKIEVKKHQFGKIQSNDARIKEITRPKLILNLPELPIQYKEYAVWQKEYLSGKRLKEQIDYWIRKLDGYEILNLPLDNPRSLQISYIGDDIPFTLNKSISKKIRLLAQDLNVSLYSVLLSGFYILLSSYSNQDDIVIGTPVANRHHRQLEHLIGFFVNNLVLRSRLSKSEALVDYIKKLNEQIIEAQMYQDLPFERLVTELNVPRDTGCHPVFQVMFTVQSFGREILYKSQLFKPYKSSEYQVAKFDITAIIDDSDEYLRGVFNYSTNLFNKNTILNFIKTYRHILDQISKLNINSQEQINDLSYLTKGDYIKVMHEWNKTEKKYPQEKTLHQLFEEQVSKTPNNIAVVYEDVKLTYNELNERSNQLAHYLRETYQIQGDDLIALCLNRSEYMLITILGVLKSGAAYVPIDPYLQVERINYILKNTTGKVLIGDSKFYSNDLRYFCEIKKLCPNILIIDSQGFVQSLRKYSTENLESNITSKNLAYVIYTSGTTGSPNGVMIEHMSVINTIYSIRELYFADNDCKASFFTSYVFDVSISEIFTPLLHGYELHILSDEVRQDTDAISDYLISNKITVCYLPPALLSLIRKQDYPKLVSLIYAGESCDYDTGKYWSEHKKLYNYYGPTEVSIYCLGKQVINGDVNLIGKPLNNTTSYILDDSLNPLPIGAIGGLYIGGLGLARGYLNQQGLTKERFINNPFQSLEDEAGNRNSKLYKTGDLARFFSTDNIEYIGRNDLQMKIRGFRIEPEEIQSIINHYPGISQSVVVINESNDNKYLVAYYVANHELDEILLSAFMSKKLPEYMLPTAYIHIDRIPLSVNGKLNKKALPSPSRILKDNYLMPQNTAETKVCTIYSEVLTLPFDQVGINHDFFRLGGNSILAIKLLYKLQQEFKISLNDIFKLRTPTRIARLEPSAKNSLYYNLTQVKSVYDRLVSYEKISNLDMQNKQVVYLQKVKRVKFALKLKKINNTLLTGVTGHLGCHILYQLLHESTNIIYLLIRAGSNSGAFNRIDKKFKYYFDADLSNFRHRIITIAADIEKPNLGMSKRQYHNLINNIDSVIHAAALVKHYGDYAMFYQANVQATINLLELAKQTKLKDFHYISTLSVLENGYIPNYQYYIFTEDDDYINLKNNNVYIQTKYEGELAAIRYREFGVNSNIYRLGNLAMNSKNYRVQENFEENAFFTRVKTILRIGMIPSEIAKVEVSPVDYTALAITKLFNQAELSNKIYHVANPHICDLSELLAKYNKGNVKTVAFEQFIDAMLVRLNNRIDREQIERFMLHQMWLEESDLEKLTKIRIFQNKTDAILRKLDFKWAPIKSNMISDIITKSFLGDKKMKEKEPIFEYLESIAELIPAPFYWLDLKGICIGLNTLSMRSVGGVTKEDVIGKTAYEFYQDITVAREIQQYIDEVIKTGVLSIKEDKIIDITTGQTRYFSSTRAPLRNKKGELIGIIGTAVETTAQKEAEHLKHENRKLEAENKLNQVVREKEAAETERLRLENAVQKLENDKHQAAAEEQAKFREIVGQVLHDIQSPLASLKGIVEDTAANIPEENRVILRQASVRIHDISQNMLIHFRNEQQAGEMAEPLLVSTALLEILSEKRFEHRGINIDTDIAKDAYFACIQIEPSQFKRMISNVVNNSAYAVGNKADGVVTVKLKVNAEWITVFVEDNGCGMSQELIKKIENNQSVTSGKENGTGIGLTQVREVLNQNFGQLTISSEEGKYTIVMLKFPKILPPFWLAEEIKIAPTDTVVVLDDDPSIHGAWDSKLRPVITQTPEIRVMHFSEGQEAVNFINLLTEFEKEHICLLADYELLHQDINGLDVIEQTKVKRSTLVTSHYTNAEIRERAASLRVRILPKMLAFAVNINLIKNIKPGSKQVDIVWVDDARWFIKDWAQRLSHLNIDTYYDPNVFLEDVHQYPLDTKIILDRNYYDREGIGRKFLGDGLVIAKTLHEIGYTQLYMVTGETPDPSIIPDYLTVILKTDHEKIKELAKA